MQKEIIDVDKENNIMRVTTRDERWYMFPSESKETGLPEYRFVPSVTWIAGFYPKGVAFYKWLADKGWDEAEAIKSAAGDKGSKVHKAIEDLIAGETVRMDAVYSDRDGNEYELSVEEYEAILSFARWANETNPEFLIKETTVISEKYGFAGTVDCVAKIGDEVWIIDWKTSQSVWPEYELQLSAYKQALKEMGRKTENVKLAILQVGYRKNKNGWKWNVIEDQFKLFLSARSIWEKETSGAKPKQRDYPLEIALSLKKAKTKAELDIEREIKLNSEKKASK